MRSDGWAARATERRTRRAAAAALAARHLQTLANTGDCTARQGDNPDVVDQ